MQTIAVDYDLEQLTYTLYGVSTVISFTTILASDAWTIGGIIGFISTSGSPISINRQALIDHLITGNSTSQDADTYADRQAIHKLYLVLDGASTTDADNEITNLETQRAAIDSDLDDENTANNATITGYYDALEENQARDAQQVLIDALTATMAKKQDIIDYIAANQTPPFNAWDYQDATVTQIQIDYDATVVLYVATQQAINDFNAANPNNPLPFNDALYVAKDGYETDLLGFTNDLVTALQDQIISDTSDLSDLQDVFDGMPYTEDLGDQPERTPVTIEPSILMRKMYYLTTVVQGGYTNPTMTTVTYADIATFEGLYGAIILP